MTGRPGPIITLNGGAITFDTTAVGRPNAHGTVIDSSHVSMNHPDGASFLGTLLLPGIILWSNDTAWTKVGISLDTVLDLNGHWAGGSSLIQTIGCIVTIDRTSAGLQPARGAIIAPDTITVYFPDGAQSFLGQLNPPDLIAWSNNTAWKKV